MEIVGMVEHVVKHELDVSAAGDNFLSTDDGIDDKCTVDNDMGTSLLVAFVSLLVLASTCLHPLFPVTIFFCTAEMLFISRKAYLAYFYKQSCS